MKLINPLVVLRILGTILLLETISFLPGLLVAFVYLEPIFPFILSSLITFLIYLVFRYISRGESADKLSIRDTFLIVTLAWILFSLFGAFPYLLSKSIPSFIDAFFESTSGFSTTGASILADVENLPYSILFYRSFTHWIGGIGIIFEIRPLVSLKKNYHSTNTKYN